MEQSVEEIVESFEIVDKKECSSDCGASTDSSSVKTDLQDDESNNNSIELDDTTTTTATTSDTNNNQSKIRKFSRDELIKMKQSMPPTAAPISEEVKFFIYKENPLDKTLDRNRANRGDAVDKMMPAYANSRGSYTKQRSVDYSQGRRSQQGNRSNSSQNLVHKNLIRNEDVKLNTAENAWKPTAMVKDVELPESESKTAELMKQFRSILNKLTPENFSTLIQNLKQLEIDTVDRLDECISLVFEKAITEPNYSASYAQLCKEVSAVFVVLLSDEENTTKKAVFKNRLITQCQNEFMKHRGSEIAKTNAEKLKAIEDEEDQAKKDELKAEMDDQNFKIRRRAVGTVHFIGELYKIEMLTSKIMSSCVSHLLDPSMCSEETLECLCKLLTTIGKRLEKTDAKKVDLSECFAKLTGIADKKNPFGISSRIRFMIQDLIELRLNHWTPRRLQRENKPLTMDEIKKQAEMEQYSNKMDIRESDNRNRSFNSANKPQRGGGNGNNVNDDGWNTPSYSKKSINFDVKKLNNLPQVTDDIVLGGGVPSFQNFSSNRFSGLLREEDTATEQQQQQQSNQNRNQQYQGRYSGGGQNMNNNRNSYDRNNRRNNNSNRSAGSRSLQPMGISQNQQNDKQFTPGRKISHQPMSRPNDLPKPSMTRKISAPARPMTDRRTENLISDQKQANEAIQKSVNAYQCEEITMNEVIDKLQKFKIEKKALFEVFNWSFDKREKERFMLADIICNCVSNDLIVTRDLIDALQDIFEVAQDLACDLPHVYCYIGQLLAQPLLKRIVHIQDLLQMSKNEIEVSNGATVILNIFKVFEQKYEKKSLALLYKENVTTVKFDFQQFLDAETQLYDFFKQNGFEYLIDEGGVEEPMMVLDEQTILEIQNVLKNNDDVDSMISWVKNHIKDPTDVGFIRSLTALVLDNCLVKESEGYRVNKSKIEKTSLLLAQFIDMKDNRVLQCLYAFNAKMVEIEHAVGCTHDIITCLYDNFAITKKGFNKWKDDKNPKEQEGKGVTLKSCTGFIDFLKDESDGEDN